MYCGVYPAETVDRRVVKGVLCYALQMFQVGIGASAISSCACSVILLGWMSCHFVQAPSPTNFRRCLFMVHDDVMSGIW